MTGASMTTLFEAARAIPNAERGAFLDDACPHPAMRRDLERMLRHDVDAPELFRRVAAGITMPARPEQLIGERIGVYRIDRCLGQGGMGVVYLAHRDDGEFEHEVALKLVTGELAGDARRELFLRERQILARLDHPNIARLFDGGVTSDGKPWFVMEYVEGRPLTAFADEQRLSVRQRLTLFLEVCAAVGHAHHHMIVHQDIKPGNVLVTENGTPKLLDFGVAGRLDECDVDGAPRGPAAALGTPGYASPEQKRGETVTAASDVYSLGVVLGELLWGRRTVQDQHSTRHSRSDLAWICERCTAEDPSRRYATVDELAADIERHLGYRPVRARPASLGYRIGRFTRRHRVGVVATGLVAAVTSLYVMAELARARDTARQRDRAEIERDASHRVVAFLTQVLDARERSRQDRSNESLREALDDELAHLEGEVSDDSERHGVILRGVGETYARLGFSGRGVNTLRRSIEVLIATNGIDHPSVAASWQVLGGMLLQHGCVGEAQVALERALAIQEPREAEEPTIARTREDLDRVRSLALGLHASPVSSVGADPGPPPAARRALSARAPIAGADGTRGASDFHRPLPVCTDLSRRPR